MKDTPDASNAKDPTDTSADAKKTPKKVEHVIVVRESDIANMILMENMLAKTLATVGGIAGVREARVLGLAPLRHPERYGAEERRTTNHRMVLFNLEGTLFLYAMGSAAKEDPETLMNDFAAFLIEVLDQFAPENVHMAGISRLLRSTSLVGKFQESLKRNGVILHADNSIMNLREQSGEMMFAITANFAAFERDQIVMRTTAGRVAAAEAGRPLFRVSDLPLGYQLQADGRIGPDPRLKPEVDALLRVLSMDELTSRQKAQLLSDAGIRMPRGYGLDGSDDPGDSRDPKSVIRGMRKWLPLYETGVYTQHLANPFLGATRIGTATVVRENPKDAGTIEVPNRWGLPEGGWTTPQVLAAARASVDAYTDRRAARAGSGAHGHRRRKPLLGLARWEDDGQEWLLDSHNKADYRLRRRACQDRTSRSGWTEVTIDGDLVARIPAAALHTSIADAVTGALAGGVPAQRLQGTFIAAAAGRMLNMIRPENITAGLRSQIAEKKARAARCRKMAATLDSPEDAQPWFDDAVEASRQVRSLQAELDELDCQQQGPSAALVDPMEVDALMCAHAMATLKRIDTDADRQVADALGRLLRNVRFAQCGDGYVQWSLELALPTEHGGVLFGPITGKVKERTRFRPTPSSCLTTEPRRRKALDILATGENMPAVVAAIPDWSFVTARNNMSQYLLGRGLPRVSFTALQSCPINELRQIVFSSVQRHPHADPADLDRIAHEVTPGDLDPAWSRLVLDSYLFPEGLGPPGMWAAKSVAPQLILDLLLTAGGSMTIHDLGTALEGHWNRCEILELVMRDKIKGGRRQRTYTQPDQLWQFNTRGRLAPDSRLSLIPCPHCDGWASRIWRAAEVPRQLVCTTCRRMPEPDSPTFPIAYLELPSGGQENKRTWDILGPSLARQHRDATLSPEDRAALQRPCERCTAHYIPARGNQKYCPPCGEALFRGAPPLPTSPPDD